MQVRSRGKYKGSKPVTSGYSKVVTKDATSSPSTSKFEAKAPLLPMVFGSEEKFNLIITSELLLKIQHLCLTFPNREWSGIVFYDVEGSVTDIANLKATAFDIYPLDVGTGTYTEFSYSPDLTGYLASKPELMDSRMGLMHSHQSMGVFFSGTDISTLQEQVPFYKVFLSIIVNNRLEIEASMSVLATIKTAVSQVMLEDVDYENKLLTSEQIVEEKQIVYRYNPIITKENVTTVPADFIATVTKLANDPTKHSYKTKNTSYTPPTTTYTSNHPNNYGYVWINGERVYLDTAQKELPFAPDSNNPFDVNYRQIEEITYDDLDEDDKEQDFLDTYEPKSKFNDNDLDDFVRSILVRQHKELALVLDPTAMIDIDIVFSYIKPETIDSTLSEKYANDLKKILASYKEWDSVLTFDFLNAMKIRLAEYLDIYSLENIDAFDSLDSAVDELYYDFAGKAYSQLND